MTFVAQSHDVVSLGVDLAGFTVQFSDDSLFKSKATAERSQLRKFVIHETGESENPDVEMKFSLYAPFSTALWKWCGQFAGEEFWASFTQSEAAQPADLELSGEAEGEEEEEGDTEK
jgi:hypothetical protein